ncbi:MAG: hypothetical protein ACYS76_08320 [Planctomycetota bacterium]|jgi:hypothetical protein
MSDADQAEKRMKTMEFKAGAAMHERILRDVLKAHEEYKKTKSAVTQPNVWRIVMKSRITKLATVAAMILIVVLGITFLDKAVAPAWAIEQTIDLLRKFNGMHITGTMLNEEGKEMSFEAWARANEDQTASNHLRLVTRTGEIDVVSGDRRYEYDPATQTVKVTEGYGQAIGIWFGADFFESLKTIVLDWNETYGKDPATDRDRVFVTCSHPAAPDPRSFWFEFDVESKLPISFKQWENMAREGTPSFYAKSIKYLDDLPDEMFQFEIPEGARTVPALAERNNKLQDPNSGMLLGNMTEEQACVEITRRYWQAVIEQDWQTVAILCPISTAEEWENKYNGSNFEEIVEIKESCQEDGCTIVPCTIRFDGYVTRTINTTVIFRTIDGQQSCVIANTWSQDWD